MVQSVLSSSHFFYLSFFNAEKVKSATDIIGMFPNYYEFEEIKTGSPTNKYYHLQVEIDRLLGTESLLRLNLSQRIKGNTTAYWYDFYLGEMLLQGRRVFFICFPYIRLSSYVDDLLLQGQTRRKYLKPDVDAVLTHLKANPSVDYEKRDQKIFKAEISKYAAIVKDDSANKINILGSNPLTSHVYKVLSEDEEISIEPLSLKLSCSEDKKQLDLSFDKYGNMRFWLRRNEAEDLNVMLGQVIDYFYKINALKEENFISKSTTLEDEQ